MRKDDYLYFHGKTDDVWKAPYLSITKQNTPTS